MLVMFVMFNFKKIPTNKILFFNAQLLLVFPINAQFKLPTIAPQVSKYIYEAFLNKTLAQSSLIKVFSAIKLYFRATGLKASISSL